jgi:hypothetical protein
MAKTVSVNKLAEEIVSQIKTYTDDVSEAVEKEVDETTKKVLKEVRSGGPYDQQTGKYKKGFAKTKTKKGDSIENTVWNEKHYQRVHLLELGHASVDGGRVKAYPHLTPAYEKHAKDLDKRIEKIIKNGG